jgi:hypothetical protein
MKKKKEKKRKEKKKREQPIEFPPRRTSHQSLQ